MGEPSQASASGSSSGRKRSREIETLSLEIRKYPRDLLHSFPPADPNTSQHHHHRRQPPRSEMEEQLEDGDLELNLGLSLGGRFGVDRSHRGLVRASSVAGTMPLIGEENSAAPPPATALARASSLPSETEEEWRRRKEWQTLRRLEAKRRKSEKQRVTEENSALEEKESGLNLKQQDPGMNPGHRVAPIGLKGKGGFIGSLQGLLAQQQQQGCSQGSAESQGGSSSGASEFESKARQGSGSFGEARSPASTQSMQERGGQESAMGLSSHTKHGEGPSKNPGNSTCKKKEAGSSRLEDMPCVFTIGDGPNGRKVDGILYRYGKGEEVRIMCICHGSFFSPAEFVKHAGGRDVEHPLRHIVVNPSASPFS